MAVVSLDQDAYLVDEDEGSAMVCIQLVDGILERSIAGNISTVSLTATGKLNFLYT